MNWEQKLETDLFDHRLFTLAGTPITVATVVLFAVLVGATLLVSYLLQRALAKALQLRKIKDEGTVAVARRLLHYLVMAIGFGIGLQTVGIDLSALFAAGAIFAIGLGFAMQNIMQNFVSGLILLVDRAIKPGDVLRVEDRFVKVEQMGIRATVARTLDDEQIIVPNTFIVQSVVTNYTLKDSLYRLRTTVGVIYGSDMRLTRKTLETIANGLDWRVQDRQPVILMSEFADSSVNWEVSVWIDDPWQMRRSKSMLNEAIWWGLKDRQITIAFPQVDIHLDPPVMESLAALRRAG